MKLNEFLEQYPEEIEYDTYHKLDEMYGDELYDESAWIRLIRGYE